MINIQEPSFDTPFSSAVDHKWRAETEHDGDQIGKGKRPSCGLCTQTLLRNLRGVRISDS